MTRACATLVLLDCWSFLRRSGGPRGKIVIAQGVDPTTLDPQWHEETPAYNVLLNIYDTLLFRDKDLKIIPWLAESWKLVNPTTWEFRSARGSRSTTGRRSTPSGEVQPRSHPRSRLKSPKAVTSRLITSSMSLTSTRSASSRQAVPDAGEPPRPPRAHHGAKHFRGRTRCFADRNPVGTGRTSSCALGQDELIELEANRAGGAARQGQDADLRPIPSTPSASPRSRPRDRHRVQHPAAPGVL